MFIKKAWALFERDLLEALSYKGQVLLELAAISAKCFGLFFLAKFLTPAIMKNLEAYGNDYFSYVILGVAVTGFQAAALESFSKAVYREQAAGTLEAILISPTSLQTVIFSNLFWSSLFAAAKLAVYLGISAVFFGLRISAFNLPAILVVLGMTLAALSGLGMISAAFILVTKRADPLAYLLSGLTQLFSGVYFPVSILPPVIRGLSIFLPLTHSLEALRQTLLKGDSIAMILPTLAPLLIFSLAAIPIGLLSFSWAIQQAQKDGSLALS